VLFKRAPGSGEEYVVSHGAETNTRTGGWSSCGPQLSQIEFQILKLLAVLM
jgi:hypothetical protein